MPRDPRLVYPATQRNGAAIEAVLTRVLRGTERVLEIASGSGQHGLRFAAAFPELTWLPSDPDARCRASVEAYREDAGLPNLRPPVALDVHTAPWPVAEVDALFCANMIHIAPWTACVALLAGARRHVLPGGPVVLYGPFRRDGAHTSESNERFDLSLRQRDPSWGVRDLETVRDEAGPELALEEVVQMPANNLCVIFRRS